MSFLTDKEVNRIDEVDSSLTGGSNCWEIVTWAMKDIQNALNAGDINHRTASSLCTIVLNFCGALSSLFNNAETIDYLFLFPFGFVSLLRLSTTLCNV
jgi:hypothetical protein